MQDPLMTDIFQGTFVHIKNAVNVGQFKDSHKYECIRIWRQICE